MLDFAVQEGTSYFTFNIPNSKCEDCGHIVKAPIHTCPKCGKENITWYTRIIGYLRPVTSFSKDRQIEASKRTYSKQIGDINEIRIGNILINPDDVSSIHLDMQSPIPTTNKERGFHKIQIIYKNGVVKNFTSAEIGMSYEDFIQTFSELMDKKETDRIFRLMAALKTINNE